MEDDNEFGDLYTNVLRPFASSSSLSSASQPHQPLLVPPSLHRPINLNLKSSNDDDGFSIGFSIGFVDDLWSDWCYVVLLLMLDDLDVLSLIWLGFDLLVFFFFFEFLGLCSWIWICVLVQDTLRSQLIWFLVFNLVFNFFI